jgi:hypothetical protein
MADLVAAIGAHDRASASVVKRTESRKGYVDSSPDRVCEAKRRRVPGPLIARPPQEAPPVRR